VQFVASRDLPLGAPEWLRETIGRDYVLSETMRAEQMAALILSQVHSILSTDHFHPKNVF